MPAPPPSLETVRVLSAHAFRASLGQSPGSGTQPTPPPGGALRQPLGVGDFAALKQACSTECHGAQGAFKDSMIHGILQFTLPIAFRCVLHRWENQEIRCRKLCYICWPVTVQRYISRSYKSIRVCVINQREKGRERESYMQSTCTLSLPFFLTP